LRTRPLRIETWRDANNFVLARRNAANVAKLAVRRGVLIGIIGNIPAGT
jgi:hypothetical protein